MHATIEELLEEVFSTVSVSRCYKEENRSKNMQLEESRHSENFSPEAKE
jgi:hypothetical protein